MTGREFRIGTAGWAIPATCASASRRTVRFCERYADRFACVEINSSFYRPHRPSTYARWAASVPGRLSLRAQAAEGHHARAPARRRDRTAGRFSRRVRGARREARRAARAASAEPRIRRRRRRGVLRSAARAIRRPARVRAAPSDVVRRQAGAALCASRSRASPPIRPSCPRPRRPADGTACTTTGCMVLRARTTRRTSEDALVATAAQLVAQASPAWCIFDNTASGVAAANALDLTELVS